MANGRKYYVICEDNCKFESMTKEQILSAIVQAAEEGVIHDVDTGFVTKLKEQNAGKELKVWVGSQAQYNALIPAEDTLYFITDPSMEAELQTQIDSLKETVANAQEKLYIPHFSISEDDAVNYIEGGKVYDDAATFRRVYQEILNHFLGKNGFNDISLAVEDFNGHSYTIYRLEMYSITQKFFRFSYVTQKLNGDEGYRKYIKIESNGTATYSVSVT